jgi:flagellar hook-associated protein 2
MGRIQSNIGLVTGLPIGDVVKQLMALAAKPRDMVVSRTDTLRQEQIAITELSAMLLSVQYVTANLAKSAIYDQRKVTSSNESALSATLTGKPPRGTYQFTPLRTSQYHQLLSSGLRSDSEPLGGGTLTFRYGDHVQRSTALELFGGGEGVARGRIRVTDRSGSSAEIDLSTVQTIDDVLEAINGTTSINVTAVANGDRIRLIDNTGRSVSNLMVQEIAGGTTAASLGLAGIDAAAATADGEDRLWLTRDTELALLNDGSGVEVSSVFDDLVYELRDGTSGTINFSPLVTGSSEVKRETTLGDILDVINARDPEKLKVRISADGDRLVVTDLTEGDGTFKIESFLAEEATTAEDLGIVGESADGVITGRRLLGGLKTVLLSSLGGGKGLGELGALELTDRSGMSDTVVLSGAETLEQVIEAINSADVGILASVNAAKNGIQLTDTTGAMASNLIVADADGRGTAAKLGLAVDTDLAVAGSGDMHLQVVSRHTRLEDLNGGEGVSLGRVNFFDSAGHQDWLQVNANVQTIDDVIRAINHLDVRVLAELNEAGDGIRIRDTAGGLGKLQVYEAGSTTAADLHLLGGMSQVEIDGQTTQVVDGSTTYKIQLGADDSLDDLRQKINDLDAGVAANTFVDGSARPFRLSLISERAGRAGRLVVDTSAVDFSMDETVRARDALLVLGEADNTRANVLLSSATNTFTGAISGVNLRIKAPSNQPVIIQVEGSDADLMATVKTTVDNYNRFRERLAYYTAYDAETDTSSVLTSDSTALRLDSDLSYFLSGRFIGAGPIQSLGELGVGLKDDGSLEFDSAKLKAKFAEDPQSVEKFFTDEEAGLTTRLGRLFEQLTGQDTSLMANRFITLSKRIAKNEEKIDWLNARLDRQQEKLYTEFYRMEIAIGKMQSSMSALSAIQPLAPITTSSQN